MSNKAKFKTYRSASRRATLAGRETGSIQTICDCQSQDEAEKIIEALDRAVVEE
jgi:hypothetical protein